jgi:hypothetical protein
VVDGVSLDFHVQAQGAGSYGLLIEGADAAFQTTTGPILVSLSIGDDGGSTLR